MHATRYASIFASLPFALVVTDRQGGIRAGNPVAERLLGWPITDWHGRSMAACLEQAITDPAQALCWTVALSQALAQGQTTYLNLPVDFCTAHPDGRAVTLTGMVAPWQLDDGKPAGAIVALHDSLQYKNLSELRSRFFSVISHELGSPITNIAAAADLLAQQLASAPDSQRRLLQIVQDETARVRRMMGQFLATSPAQAGTLRPARHLVTLRPLLQRVLQTFSVRDTGHRLVLQVPPNLPFVEGDPDRIQEVLSNLIDNATRYSSPGTPIILAAEERDGELLVSVTDEGRGVPAGDEDRIFEPFYRGHSNEQEGGQGVGLYMARNIVQALGGELWHEQKPNRGSRFCFTLVRAPDLTDKDGEEDNGCPDPGR